MSPNIIYLSGPITGVADYQERFARAERILRSAWQGRGIYIINPAVRHPAGLSNAEYVRLSLAEIDASHDVCLLPGWEDSTGAQLELAYANYIGIPSFQIVDRFPECYPEETQ